ncbi:hypothetical protein AGMMS50268_31480 [Spirochaetia bacterium]|nr:hypothetical protein AGMMS50268_31480 [Spirochaetia bacterium]
MKIKKSLFRSDSIKVLLLRMWAAGAVCFFGAWGRAGAEEVGQAYSLNLIAGLIVLLVICDWIIVNPLIRYAFKKRPPAKPDKKVWRIFLEGLLHIIKITAAVLFIVGVYYLLNILFIHLFHLDEKSVPVPLEPLLFGILYGLCYTGLDFIEKKLMGKIGGKNELL